jgi:hypothetical protein
VTEGKQNPKVKQVYDVLVCVYRRPFCVRKRPFSGKHLLRKLIGWRGEISRKTLHLSSLRTDSSGQTYAVRNETYKKLSVSVIVQEGHRSVAGITQHRPGFDHRSSCVEFVSKEVALGQFPLPLSSHQRSTPIFIYTLLLPEGQTGL